MNSGINKTAVISTLIVTMGVCIMAYLYFGQQERVKISSINAQVQMQTETQSQNETRDRFTVCVQTVMTEARESSKPIDAAKAGEICQKVK